MNKSNFEMIVENEREIQLLKKNIETMNIDLKTSRDHISRLEEELKVKNEEQDALREATQVISSTFEIIAIVEYMYDVFKRFTCCDRYIVCLVDTELDSLVCRYEYGRHVPGFIGASIDENSATIKECYENRKIVAKRSVLLQNIDKRGDKVAFPLSVSGEIIGVIYIEREESGKLLSINLGFLESLINYAAIAMKNAQLFTNIYHQKQEIVTLYEETAAVNEELSGYVNDLNKAKEELKEKNDELKEFYNEIQTGYLQTVTALANSIEAKDPYTRGHCQRVMEISCEIAKQLNLEQNIIEDLRYAAILHDIGKIGISANILNKVERLDEIEFDEIKKHPQIAYSILKDVGFLRNGLDAIIQHHERYDGKGYPFGIKSDQISICGKILCVADAFDAMTSDRPYRKGMPMEKAIMEIEKCKGSQFDPQIADIFINMSKGII